jgi:arylsulfatase A-like enzyme
MQRPHLVLLLVLSACAATGTRGADRPNFVFLLADDLGWSDLACYGSSFYETPNLDRLAGSGVRFTQAYATAPVCSPTRASILNGKYPARTNTTEWFGGRRKGDYLPAEYQDHMALADVTIAEALRAADYATFFAGKWHLGDEGHHPEDQGFDVNVAGFKRGSPPGGYFSPYENPKLADGQDGEHLTGRLTDECVSFLRERGDEPFLMYLSYYAVHTPLQSRPDLQAKYEAKAARLAPHDGPKFLAEGPREARQVQDHAVYAGMVAALDESVGRLLDELEALGLADDTIVIFMSDNGGLSTSEGSPTSNLPLRGGKGWTYEGGIREPMLVRWPGVTRAGSVCDVPVTATDFYPTMLEMAGLPKRPEQHVDGTSFAPLLRGEDYARAPLFWHYPHYSNQGGPPSGAVRDGELKLIERFEGPSFELYDLAADPGESRDLAAERPGEVARLRGQLLTWRAEVGARMLRRKSE